MNGFGHNTEHFEGKEGLMITTTKLNDTGQIWVAQPNPMFDIVVDAYLKRKFFLREPTLTVMPKYPR